MVLGFGFLSCEDPDPKTGPQDEQRGTKQPGAISTSRNVVSVAAGEQHSLAIDADGNLWAWGETDEGQIGNGTYLHGSEQTPVQIKAGTKWSAVAAGRFHSLAIDAGGNLWGWGSNRYGQLGNGNMGYYQIGDLTYEEPIPIQIKAGTKWTAIAAGSDHSLAIDADGNLWVWGHNYYGQLGNGNSGEGAHELVPVQIRAGTKWSAIAAGWDHSLAIDASGNLWAWGYNGFGQLGNGTGGISSADQAIPVPISPETKWTAIAAGWFHNLAIDASGNLWAWGLNSHGQLGNGKNGNYGSNYYENYENTPVQIKAGTKWTAIAVGSDHSLAIDASGNLWTCGLNEYGQLGNGTSGDGSDKNIPIQIKAGIKWTAIAGGWNYSLAAGADEGLWAWGYNGYRQLGLGESSPDQIATPEQVHFP